MKKLLLAVYFAPLAFFLTGEAWALPNILEAWQEKYSGVSSSDTVNCQLCHWNSTGGDPWNDYGWAVRVKYINNGRTNINLAFEQVETDDSDVDPTSSNNLKEIQANTQPGWTKGAHNIIHRKDDTFTKDQEPPDEFVGIVLDPTPADISVTPGSVDFAM